MTKQTALITGASSGIGLELSKLFAKDGYDLVLVARSTSKLDSLASELKQAYGTKVTVITKDLSQTGAAEEIFQLVQSQGLQIEALVNNAGFGIHTELAKGDLNESLQMIQLNVTSLTVLTQLFLAGMVERGAGRIMNVGSTGSFSPVPLMAVYGGTKAYVLSFSEALTGELRGSGVTVTALCPGVTITGFQARSGVGSARMVRLGSMTAEQVAKVGYQALMRGKRVVVPGLFNKIMTGMTPFTPRPLVLWLARQLMEV